LKSFRNFKNDWNVAPVTCNS